MNKLLVKILWSGESSNVPKPPLASKSWEENTHADFNLDDIVSDLGLWKPIEDFDIGIRDQARRKYLTKGPCQLIGYNFPQKEYGKQRRAFEDALFNQHPWLLYSVTIDVILCFWCYLFNRSKGSGIKEDGFSKWGSILEKALEKFAKHVGDVNSAHNNARVQFQTFQNQRQSVSYQLAAHSHEMGVAYHIRLTSVLDMTCFFEAKFGFPWTCWVIELIKQGSFL